MSIQLKSITTKQWLIGIAVVTVVASLFIGWRLSVALGKLGPDPVVWGWMRSAGNGSSLYETIAKTMKETDEQRIKARKLDDCRKLLASMQNDILVARKRLPNETQKAEVVQLFYELARRVNVSPKPVEVTSVNINEKARPTVARPSAARGKADSGISTTDYTIALTADQDGLIKYINLIEGNQRYMTVEAITLAPGSIGADKSTGKLDAKPHAISMKVTAYIDTSAASAAGGR